MDSRPTSRAGATVASFAMAVLPAFTAAAADTPAADLAPVVVTGARNVSPTSPDPAAQRRALDAMPGSVGLVDTEARGPRFTGNLRDVLADTPGVLVDDRYGQEVRLSMRGSGLARAFHSRGIELLQDGLPMQMADGSGDFYGFDPLGARTVAIYKGGNALALGASSLGGAIDVVTPTALTAVAPVRMRVEGGSFGTARMSAQASRVFESADVLVNASIGHADGWRRHMAGDTRQLNANVGYAFGAGAETRFFLGVHDVEQRLPGTLSLRDALRDPRRASPSAIDGDQARDQRIARLANQTSMPLAGGRLVLGAWLMHKSLYHPIFQVIDQDGWNAGVSPRWTRELVLAGLRHEWTVGARVFAGANDALQFVNVGGHRGAQTLDARQRARNVGAWIEDRAWLRPDVALTVGAHAWRQTRRYVDRGGLAANPVAKDDEARFDGVDPRIGLLWRPAASTPRGIQVFANLTRSSDVPDFSDLTQTMAGTQRFVPLVPQKAWTLELGSRGQAGRWQWDLTAWRSRVRDQMLQYTVDASIPATTFNAPRTTMQGIDAAATVELARGLRAPRAGDSLRLATTWTYSDLRFDGDPQYGSNRLPVVPVHVLRARLEYEQPDRWSLAATLDWVPRGAWVDYANAERAPGYALWGARFGIAIDRHWQFYVDARNLGDKRYVSDLGAITSARTAASTVYYPGQGRAVFAGLLYAI
ncbi:MAG: TonB-dependent receptor [Burkholderiaceae bacterium]